MLYIYIYIYIYNFFFFCALAWPSLAPCKGRVEASCELFGIGENPYGHSLKSGGVFNGSIVCK